MNQAIPGDDFLGLESLQDHLRSTGLTVAVAESCTGGMLGATLTSVPGSSDVFAGGVIAYLNRVKRSQLGVPGDVLSSEGAVSNDVARLMATGLAEAWGVPVAMSLTGIAGPEGGTAHKPVGLVFGAVYLKGDVTVDRWEFSGDRQEVRCQSVESILDLLETTLDMEDNRI